MSLNPWFWQYLKIKMRNETYIEFGHSNIKSFNAVHNINHKDLKELKRFVQGKDDKFIFIITNETLRKDVEDFFKKEKIDHLELRKENIIKNLEYRYDTNDIGIDRMLLCEYISRKGIADFVFISFGTAITFNIVSNNVFKGGAIIPSAYKMYSSLYSLSGIRSKITKDMRYKRSGNHFSRNTQESVSYGIYELINSYIERYLNTFDRFEFFSTGGGIEHQMILDNTKIKYDKELFYKAVINGKYKWKD
ncbi:MAG: hypothetical protein C0601_10240 [Candidatus Muiribacterium halophilum]|uniref:Type III pantothenate kinase n=1 Tax=Muiribacterium halophilum TaxID=2053465 RepID=A0A2N5ZCQ7_MUIH1|nr:MAG: hypothetical protein C0601_10240 [Candidatus Muirbacterium halophilum]